MLGDGARFLADFFGERQSEVRCDVAVRRIPWTLEDDVHAGRTQARRRFSQRRANRVVYSHLSELVSFFFGLSVFSVFSVFSAFSAFSAVSAASGFCL